MLNPPNAVTAIRLLLVIPLSIAILSASMVAAAGWLVLFIALDILDGRLARRLHCETTFGRNFDFVVDAIGLGLAYLFLVAMGNIPLLYFSLSLVPLVLLRGAAIVLGVKKMRHTFITSEWKIANGAAFFAILACFLFPSPATLAVAWALLVFFFVSSAKFLIEVVRA